MAGLIDYSKIPIENFKKKLPPLFQERTGYNDCFIAGGAIRDCIDGKEFDDIDFFGSNVNLHLMAEELLKPNSYELVYDSDILQTYKNKKEGIKVQLILRDYKTMEEAMSMFDFTVCQFAYNGNGANFMCNPEALLHLSNKKLIVHSLPYPYDTLRRLQKYIKKGFSICDGGLKEIGDAIRAMSEVQYRDQLFYYPNDKIRINRFD